MKNPALIAQPYAHWIADILARFEDGKPLSNEQLNFLMSHDKTLSSYALDSVIKYYLSAHHEPDKHLSFTLPVEKINKVNAHDIRDVVLNVLHHQLSHVDLKMSVDQFLQFKSVGFHELIFWHGPQFLSRTMPFPNGIPLVLYFQWGKLFGVVKLNSRVNSFIMDGNVLIYFEEINNRSLNQCVLDYSKKNGMNYELHHNVTLTQMRTQEPEQKLSFVERPKFKNESY